MCWQTWTQYGAVCSCVVGWKSAGVNCGFSWMENWIWSLVLNERAINWTNNSSVFSGKLLSIAVTIAVRDFHCLSLQVLSTFVRREARLEFILCLRKYNQFLSYLNDTMISYHSLKCKDFFFFLVCVLKRCLYWKGSLMLCPQVTGCQYRHSLQV